MQAEYPPLRPSGFIITPEKPKSFSHVKSSFPKERKKTHILKGLKAAVSLFCRDYIRYAAALSRAVFKNALSVSVVFCCVIVFFRYFSFGTAVYCKDKKIAVTSSESNFYVALSRAHKKARDNLVTDFTPDFTLFPTVTLKKNVLSASLLGDELLLSSPHFKKACALYCDGQPLFYAKNEQEARACVNDYINKYSMNGTASLDSDIKYESRVVPYKNISDRDMCFSLITESGLINVVSVVNTSAEKEIPFETTTLNDADMYIGETLTVTKGTVGKAYVKEESVYKNGAEQSSRILSEKIALSPVTEVIKVGTKEKDVLKSGLYYPLSGVISSPFGERWGRMHEGMDIAVSEGTPVLAAECGKVSYVNENSDGYGKIVRIDHGNGIQTAYAHLSKIEVKVGQSVNSDTQIALSGNTGRSTGPHLHFEIIQNGTHINPLDYLKKRST